MPDLTFMDQLRVEFYKEFMPQIRAYLKGVTSQRLNKAYSKYKNLTPSARAVFKLHVATKANLPNDKKSFLIIGYTPRTMNDNGVEYKNAIYYVTWNELDYRRGTKCEQRP